MTLSRRDLFSTLGAGLIAAFAALFGFKLKTTQEGFRGYSGPRYTTRPEIPYLSSEDQWYLTHELPMKMYTVTIHPERIVTTEENLAHAVELVNAPNGRFGC
jgi:hypothetical protein